MSFPFDTLKPRGPARIVDQGCSGMVSIYVADERFVLKGYEVWLSGRRYGRIGNVDSKAALALEDTIYKRLGTHPCILKYDGQVLVTEDIYSLKLERALGNLRRLILNCPAPTEPTRLKMAMQISCGMVYMHSKNVFHCDFSCRNVFVFEDWRLKIGDFGGSKIDDEEPLAAEEARYQLPLRGRKWEELDYTKREIFALGCGIFEIMAWRAPFPGMTEDEINEKYSNEEFPDTDGLLAGDIIRACWNEKFNMAADVEIALRQKLVDLRKRACQQYRLLPNQTDFVALNLQPSNRNNFSEHPQQLRITTRFAPSFLSIDRVSLVWLVLLLAASLSALHIRGALL
jgi:serine/threonine protein kinase